MKKLRSLMKLSQFYSPIPNKSKMEEMVMLFLPFFIFGSYLCKSIDDYNPLKRKVIMKRMMLLLAFSGLLTTAMADWTYGSARFTGSQPSSCLTHGTVIIWYNGTLTQKGVSGNEEIWEGTGDICVLYPKNYNGRQLRITSTSGTVQIQTLR